MNLFCISGAAGNIELSVSLLPEGQIPQAVAVISHPHPLHGGTMNNKVVTTVVKACGLSGVIAIRHHFRGVGQTEGLHDNGVGELEDTLAVIDDAKQQYPYLPLIIIGFSFGAAMSIQAAQQHPDATLLAIAPPIYPTISNVRLIENSWHVLMGDADEVIAVETVKNWLKAQENPAIEHWFPDTSHFFHGKLIALRKTLVEILN